MDEIEIEPQTIGADRVLAAGPFVGHARRLVVTPTVIALWFRRGFSRNSGEFRYG